MYEVELTKQVIHSLALISLHSNNSTHTLSDVNLRGKIAADFVDNVPIIADSPKLTHDRGPIGVSVKKVDKSVLSAPEVLEMNAFNS